MKKLKAYKINTSNISEGFYLDGTYYGFTKGEAKSKAWEDAQDYQDMEGNCITWITLSLRRCPDKDKTLVNGEYMTEWQIREKKELQEKIKFHDDLIANHSDGYAYILKGGMYYRPDNNGYTEYKQYAGVYSVIDAVRSVKSCHYDMIRAVLIDKAVHNKMINDAIEGLQTRII